MIANEHKQESRRTARELLRFLDEVMRVARVDLGRSGADHLTLIEMRVLSALADSAKPVELRRLAMVVEVSPGQSGHVADRLRRRGLVAQAGGTRGEERAVAITRRGRRLLASLEASRQAAVEGFISGLDRTDRLRLEGAAHLLGMRQGGVSSAARPAT